MNPSNKNSVNQDLNAEKAPYESPKIIALGKLESVVQTTGHATAMDGETFNS